MLLRELLRVARLQGFDAQTALNRWLGAAHAKRDFAAVGIAIEVKATGTPTRRHHIADLQQLEPQVIGEEVFLYSVGVRSDPSAPRKLGTFVEDIRQMLVTPKGAVDQEALTKFTRQLESYGYSDADEALYSREPGFLAPHLKPALFRVADLGPLRASSFVGGAPPLTVVGVSYELEIATEPIDETTKETILAQLLSSVELN
jgi:hypothetical protein